MVINESHRQINQDEAFLRGVRPEDIARRKAMQHSLIDQQKGESAQNVYKRLGIGTATSDNTTAKSRHDKKRQPLKPVEGVSDVDKAVFDFLLGKKDELDQRDIELGIDTKEGQKTKPENLEVSARAADQDKPIKNDPIAHPRVDTVGARKDTPGDARPKKVPAAKADQKKQNLPVASNHGPNKSERRIKMIHANEAAKKSESDIAKRSLEAELKVRLRDARDKIPAEVLRISSLTTDADWVKYGEVESHTTAQTVTRYRGKWRRQPYQEKIYNTTERIRLPIVTFYGVGRHGIEYKLMTMYIDHDDSLYTRKVNAGDYTESELTVKDSIPRTNYHWLPKSFDYVWADYLSDAKENNLLITTLFAEQQLEVLKRCHGTGLTCYTSIYYFAWSTW